MQTVKVKRNPPTHTWMERRKIVRVWSRVDVQVTMKKGEGTQVTTVLCTLAKAHTLPDPKYDPVETHILEDWAIIPAEQFIKIQQFLNVQLTTQQIRVPVQLKLKTNGWAQFSPLPPLILKGADPSCEVSFEMMTGCITKTTIY